MAREDAITSIYYPYTLDVSTKEYGTLKGVLTYSTTPYHDGRHIVFPDTNNRIPLKFEYDSSDPDKIRELPLYTMTNGVSLSIYYRVVQTVGTYYEWNIEHSIVYKDKFGRTITDLSLGTPDHLVSHKYVDGGTVYNPYQWQDISEVPMWWYVTRVDVDEVGDPIEGDTYAPINPVGLWVVEKPYLVDTPISLVGNILLDDFRDDYTDQYMNPAIYTQTEFDEWLEKLNSRGNGTNPFPKIDPTLDPSENDPSQPGGGGGTHYDPTGTGDPVDFPSLPSVGAINTGLVSIYNPSLSQLRSLASFLWSDDFVDTVAKLNSNPMESLISLALLPFAPSTGASLNITVGNIDTGVSAPSVGNQYMAVHCGSVRIEENWRSALDYAPYTTIEMFVPFCGMKTLKTEDVMNRTISLEYNCDVLSGCAVASLKCESQVLYEWNCNIAMQIPLTASSKAEMMKSILSVLESIGTGTLRGAITGGMVGGVEGAITGGVLGGTHGAISSIASGVNTVAGKQTTVSRGGSLSSNYGALGHLTPYVIIHRPIQSLPSNFKGFKGYMSNITMSLGSLNGYTEVDYIHLDGINATEQEKNELDRILHSGFII